MNDFPEEIHDSEAVKADAGVEAVKEEFSALGEDMLLEVLNKLCPKELDSLVSLAAEREYERRVEDSLQSEADQRGDE